MNKGSIVGKVYSFVNRFVPTIENKATRTYLYGVDDLLPNNNLRMINECGVAKRCVSKKARYIQGDGFSNKELAKMRVNSFQTADDFLAHASSYASYNDGVAVAVSRSADLTKLESKIIPFECVRKTTDGAFIYNPTKGQPNYDPQKDVKHPTFNPSITAEQYARQLKDFKAQPEIFYVYEQTASNPHYPVPDFYAGIDDILTCIEISSVDLECVLNGFMTSGIFTTPEIDSVNKDESGRTPLENLERMLRSFTGKRDYVDDKRGNRIEQPWNKWNGYSDYSTNRTNRFSLIHMMVANMAEAPTLQTFDSKPILEASNTKRDIIAREVCRLFGVNPILVGFSDAAVLGNTQALANTIIEFNNYLNPIQRMISNAMTVLYPGRDWAISQLNPINYIPAEVWAQLTPNEIRELGGFKPIVAPVATPTTGTPVIPQPITTNGTN